MLVYDIFWCLNESHVTKVTHYRKQPKGTYYFTGIFLTVEDCFLKL